MASIAVRVHAGWGPASLPAAVTRPWAWWLALALASTVGLGGPSGDGEDPYEDDPSGVMYGAGLAGGVRPGLLVPSTVPLDRAGVFYLTFDDGPVPVYTRQILRTLAAHHAPATFFVTGRRIPGNEEMLLEEMRAGHNVANHQWVHVIATASQFQEWIPQQRDLIDDIVGPYHPHYFRYPYGFGSPTKDDFLKQNGYPDGGVGWDLDSLDWCFEGGGGTCERASPAHQSDYVGHVMAEARLLGGGVVLFHDIQPITVHHLDEILTRFERAGYRFGALPRDGR